MNDNQRLPLDRIKALHLSEPVVRNPSRAGERFTENEMEEIRREFALSCASLFPGLHRTEIRHCLITTDTVVANYLDAKRLPTPELLLYLQFEVSLDISGKFRFVNFDICRVNFFFLCTLLSGR
jgi:hypothetical protein